MTNKSRLQGCNFAFFAPSLSESEDDNYPEETAEKQEKINRGMILVLTDKVFGEIFTKYQKLVLNLHSENIHDALRTVHSFNDVALSFIEDTDSNTSLKVDGHYPLEIMLSREIEICKALLKL